MNELFAINTDGNEPTISARDLHKALGIRKRFSEWFEKNSQGFIEDDDFTSVLSGTVVNNGAKKRITRLSIIYRHGKAHLSYEQN